MSARAHAHTYAQGSGNENFRWLFFLALFVPLWWSIDTVLHLGGAVVEARFFTKSLMKLQDLVVRARVGWLRAAWPGTRAQAQRVCEGWDLGSCGQIRSKVHGLGRQWAWR